MSSVDWRWVLSHTHWADTHTHTQTDGDASRQRTEGRIGVIVWRWAGVSVFKSIDRLQIHRWSDYSEQDQLLHTNYNKHLLLHIDWFLDFSGLILTKYRPVRSEIVIVPPVCFQQQSSVQSLVMFLRDKTGEGQFRFRTQSLH